MPESNLPAPWRKRLYLPAYMVKEAAMLAGVVPRTVSSWHYGYKLSGHRRSAGVFAKDRERGRPLSYLELVEVAFVGRFRQMNMPRKDIRTAHDYLSKLWNVEYPFAQLRLKTEGYEILADFEPSQTYVAANKAGQLLWADLIERRIEEFDYEHELAMRWHPRGHSVPVVIDPRISFGSPTLERSGVSTWIIKERMEAGESHDEIADDFGISLSDVHIALEFEGVELAA